MIRGPPSFSLFPYAALFRSSSLNGVTYTPSAEYEGSDTLHVSATSTDGTNVSTAATSTSSITVQPVAEVPTITPASALTTQEDVAGGGGGGPGAPPAAGAAGAAPGATERGPRAAGARGA